MISQCAVCQNDLTLVWHVAKKKEKSDYHISFTVSDLNAILQLDL